MNTTTSRAAAVVSPLAEGLGEVARRLLGSVPDLSTEDRNLLKDYSRQEPRYPMRTLERITEIARRSTRPEDAEALAALVLARSTPAESVDLCVASLDETRAQGPADVHVEEFKNHRSRATQDRALRAIDGHIARLRRLRRSVESVSC